MLIYSNKIIEKKLSVRQAEILLNFKKKDLVSIIIRSEYSKS